jgi:thiamine-monophosphate kinase
MSSSSRTEIHELGEFGLIKEIQEAVVISNSETVKGIGDDAAVLERNDEFYSLISTDMLNEGVHFDLTYCPLKHLGYKAVVVNVSDIAAMNGEATHITVSIGMSNRFSHEAFQELYSGILLAAKVYNLDIVGGDTCSSKSGLTINVCVYGKVQKDKVVYRNGAKEKELLVVSGDLGGAYVGLQVLEREKAAFTGNPNVQPDLAGNDYILERQLKPEARVDAIRFLNELEVLPTSMIDISDGLASEVLHLCDQSGVGCSLFEEKIPIDPTTYQVARDFNLDPSVCALSGGEDYELLFTVKQSDYDKIKGSPHFTVIGFMQDKSEGINLITKNGSSQPLTAQGWDAFLNKNNE